MEKGMKKYAQILSELMEEYADYFNNGGQNDAAQPVIDEKRGHFQLLTLGWEGGKNGFGVIFHFRLKDGKIWLDENNTDIPITDDLLERGVPKTDIVLGLQPPEYRQYGAFAAA